VRSVESTMLKLVTCRNKITVDSSGGVGDDVRLLLQCLEKAVLCM